MARIDPISTREQVPAEKRHLYDEIINRRGSLSGPTHYFLNSPQFAVLYSRLADYLRMEGVLNPGQVRLVSLIVGREFNCQYIWAVNLPFAAQTGPSETAVRVIGSRGDLSSLPGEEGVLARFIAEVLREHRVSDATFNAVNQLLGPQGTMELTGVISLYTMIANMANTFEVEPPPDTPRLP